MFDWDDFWSHPKRMKLKLIIMCFICDIAARIRDPMLSWQDPYGNSSISFLLVSCRLSLMTSYLGLADLIDLVLCSLPEQAPNSFNRSFHWESSVNLDVDPIIEVGAHFQSLLQWYFFFLLTVAETSWLAVHTVSLINVKMRATAKGSLSDVRHWKINRQNRSMHWTFFSAPTASS